MPTTIHTATGPNGETFKRTSKSRTYTHMVAGRRSAEAERKEAHDQHARDLKEYQQHLQWAAEGYEPSAWMIGKPASRPTFEGETVAEQFRREGKESAAKWLADKPSNAADYAAQELDRRLSKIEADEKAGGVYDRFTIDFGWSSRLDLAQKLQAISRSARYADVVILETQRTVK